MSSLAKLETLSVPRKIVIAIALIVAIVLTFLSTPDITDYKIEFNVSKMIGLFTIYGVLAYALLSLASKMFQKSQDDNRELPELTFANSEQDKMQS